jgi:hypothetical protein
MGSSAGGHLAITLLTHGDDGDPGHAQAQGCKMHASRNALCFHIITSSSRLGHIARNGSQKM